ncbi:MAG: hypothetical protein H7Z40_21410 [Phycisphaerae bacterium]|nr:hypothetical protein [Gemmatimonadaceae bacterium]
MTELLVLRVVHILAGIFWLGAGLMTSLFLVPALSSAGAAGGAVMQALRARGLMTWMPVAAGLTMFSGTRLFWIASGGALGAYAATPSGRVFALAGAASVAGFLIAMFVGRPAQQQAMQLQQSAVDHADKRKAIEQRIARLRRRGSLASLAGLLLLVASATGMSVARYV